MHIIEHTHSILLYHRLYRYNKSCDQTSIYYNVEECVYLDECPTCNAMPAGIISADNMF